MINNLENINQEKLVVPEIILRIFRHSIKEGERESDKKTHLTEEGRDLARSKYDSKLKNVLAYGSPMRERSQETAALMAFGSETENFEDTKKYINKDLVYASRLGVDPKLDFKNGDKTPYKEKLRAAFYSNNFLKFLAEDSDSCVKELGNKKSATYSRMAGQIAQIVNKYFTALDNWTEILENKPDKYDSLKLERFLCTHQGLGESFLSKIVEKTLGVGERDKFIKALNNQGFDFTEGLEIAIKNTTGKKLAHVSFSKDLPNGEKYSFEQDIPQELIEEIIKEGED